MLLTTGTINGFALDGSGSVVLLEGSGNLIRIAPGSMVMQVLDGNNVSSFAVDGSGSVIALEGGGTTGTLVRFAPGFSGPSVRQVIDVNPVSGFFVNRNGIVIAIDYVNLALIGGVTVSYNSLVSFDPPQQGYGRNTMVESVAQVALLPDGTILVISGNSSLLAFSLSADANPATIATNVKSFTYAGMQTYQQWLENEASEVTHNPPTTFWSIPAQVGEIVGAALVSYFVPVAGAALGEMIVDAGIASDTVVAGVIGDAVAASAGAAALQGYDSLAFGTSFNWLKVVTSGLTEGLDDIGDINGIVGNVINSEINQLASGNFSLSGILQGL